MFIGNERICFEDTFNKLNPSSNFNNDLASEKTIITHRIVNLMNLTEVHET